MSEPGVRVFKHHQLVAEHDPRHRMVLDGEDLLIVQAKNLIVHRYKEGEWHAAGLQNACGGVVDEDDLDCPICHPKLPAAPPEQREGRPS